MEPMDVTVTKMFIIQDNQFLKAFCDILLNDSLLIKGFKVVETRSGLSVGMPQEKAKDSKWYDSVKCINKELLECITERVLDRYSQESGKMAAQF